MLNILLTTSKSFEITLIQFIINDLNSQHKQTIVVASSICARMQIAIAVACLDGGHAYCLLCAATRVRDPTRTRPKCCCYLFFFVSVHTQIERKLESASG
jgi:hypothetical protein